MVTVDLIFSDELIFDFKRRDLNRFLILLKEARNRDRVVLIAEQKDRLINWPDMATVNLDYASLY